MPRKFKVRRIASAYSEERDEVICAHHLTAPMKNDAFRCPLCHDRVKLKKTATYTTFEHTCKYKVNTRLLCPNQISIVTGRCAVCQIPTSIHPLPTTARPTCLDNKIRFEYGSRYIDVPQKAKVDTYFLAFRGRGVIHVPPVPIAR